MDLISELILSISFLFFSFITPHCVTFHGDPTVASGEAYAAYFVNFLLTPLFGMTIQCFSLFYCQLWWDCSASVHATATPLPLSWGSFAPMGPSSVALRVQSLSFWFIFLFLFVFTTMKFPPPSLSCPMAASCHWTLHQWCHGQRASLRGGFHNGRAILYVWQLGFSNPVA